MRLRNRQEAGRLLAKQLLAYARRPDVIVLALPRGGVPVAFEVAQALQVPLDLCLVRKLGVPGQPELAMGAIGSGDVRVINGEIVEGLGISVTALNVVAAEELQELQRRDRVYRGDRPFPDLRGQTVILMDDGIATGSTMRAAIQVIRARSPERLIVAVPVAPRCVCDQLSPEVDCLVALLVPEHLSSISVWYRDFEQTSDEEVCQLLAIARGEQPHSLGRR
jgi:putative phosphoribosyl transferase